MKAEFITSVNEGLFFTRKASLEKMDLEQCTNYAFLILCALNVLRHEKETMAFAADYASKTLLYGVFKGFRSTATDLYNLLAILQDPNQANLEKLKQHSSNMFIAQRIHMPVLQTKSYLRDVAMGKLDENKDRQFFFKLDQGLNITNNDYSAIRRLTSDWHKLDNRQRKLAMTRLLLALRHMGTSDILKQLEHLSRSKNYEIKDVCDPETGENCDVKSSTVEKPKKKSGIGSAISKGLAISAAAALGGAVLGYALTRGKK